MALQKTLPLDLQASSRHGGMLVRMINGCLKGSEFWTKRNYMMHRAYSIPGSVDSLASGGCLQIGKTRGRPIGILRASA